MRASSRRTVLSLVLAAVSLASWTAGVLSLLRRRSEREHVAALATRARADVRGALGDALRALSDEAGRASGLPPLRAALAHEVDTATFRDLLTSEEWWAPLRERLVLVLGPDGQRVDSGPGAEALLDQRLVADARARLPAAGWVGGPELLAAAAVPISVAPTRATGRPAGRPGAPHVLILGRPLDQALLQQMAARLQMTLLVSDGQAGGLRAGEAGHRAHALGLVGTEARHVRLDPFGRWLAVPLSIRPDRWLWAVRHLGDSRIAPVWFAPGLLALGALTSLGLAWSLRPRPSATPGATTGPG